MSKDKDLRKLAENRKNILLAELAAWLHDWHKCIDSAVASHWKKSPYVDETKIQEWESRKKTFKPGDFACSLDIEMQVCDKAIVAKELVETGRDPLRAKKSLYQIVQLLGHCHDTGHIEKELELKENENLSTDWLASPLGENLYSQQVFLGFC